MTTVNFKTTADGKLIITAYRSDIGHKLKGDDLIDVLDTVKGSIDECVKGVIKGDEF